MTEPKTDLIPRARRAAANECRERAGLIGEMADEIGRLRAERDALRSELWLRFRDNARRASAAMKTVEAGIVKAAQKEAGNV